MQFVSGRRVGREKERRSKLTGGCYRVRLSLLEGSGSVRWMPKCSGTDEARRRPELDTKAFAPSGRVLFRFLHPRPVHSTSDSIQHRTYSLIMASATQLRLVTRAFSSTTTRSTRSIHPALRPYLCPRLATTHIVRQRALHTSKVALATPSSSPSSSTPATTSSSSTSAEKGVTTTKDKPKGTRLQRIWTAVKKEASHYWHGTKLLGKEIRISARIQGRLLAGKKLTRREHRQVSSTA